MAKMLKTVVKINDHFFAGESDEYYGSSFNGAGWQDYKGRELNVLKLVESKGDAKIIEGNTNLKSVLDKILQRVRGGQIDLERIEIIKEK